MTNANVEQATVEIAATGTPQAATMQSLAEASVLAIPAGADLQSLFETATTGSPEGAITQCLLELSIALPSTPMIPTNIFPDFTLAANGAGWSVHRRPMFSTRVATAVSGRKVKSPNYVVPIYQFELIYDGLNSSGVPAGALGAQTLQALQGFFLQCQGQYGSFLFTDPENCSVTGGALGTGDGSATLFALKRTVGPYSEQIQVANVVSAVYLNGVAQAGGTWSVLNGNQLSFASAPGNGVNVTADFSYYFACEFVDDVHDYEEFMYQLHTLQSCKIQSVRVS